MLFRIEAEVFSFKENLKSVVHNMGKPERAKKLINIPVSRHI
jgi:hypothetical protein